MTGNRLSKPLHERFWEKVNRLPGEDGCWEWTGSIDAWGYGQFWYNDRPLKAHRWIFEMASGPLPEGYLACHKCDNRRCVRIGHLFAGTGQDNSDDAVRKGRFSRHGTKKLPAEVKSGIATMHAEGKSLREVADHFKVSVKTAHKYVRAEKVHFK